MISSSMASSPHSSIPPVRYADGTSIIPVPGERAPPSPSTLRAHMIDFTHPADIAAAATIAVAAAAAAAAATAIYFRRSE